MKILMIAVLMLCSTPAWAAGDAVAGKEKAATCQACHGVDGNAQAPIYPKLAGQYESYLLRALLDYKSGERKNAIMAGMVMSLSEKDMADLAAYYASQSGLINTTP